MALRSSDLKTASWRTAVIIGALFAGWAVPARATIVLEVDVESGDLKLVGQPGTRPSYTIYSASGADSLLYTNWNADRLGGTPVGAITPTSVALGYGMWHSMGTVTPPAGQTATSQLGEMSAVYAGYATGGSPNAQTSKSFTFTAGDTVIDLGDHFIAGSLDDLVFGYGPTPGFHEPMDFRRDDAQLHNHHGWQLLSGRHVQRRGRGQQRGLCPRTGNRRVAGVAAGSVACVGSAPRWFGTFSPLTRIGG